MDDECFSSRIEWEWLSHPVIYENVELEEPEKSHVDKISINRGNDYSLYVTVEIEEDSQKRNPFDEQFSHPSPTTLSFNVNDSGDRLIIHGSFCKEYNSKIIISKNSSSKRYTLIPTKIEVDFAPSEPLRETDWLVDWYLNGIDHLGVFAYFTDREFSPTLIRERSHHPREKEGNGDNTINLTAASNSCERDYFPITYSQWTILVTKVPKNFGPEWSINIGIEYHPDEEGNFPSSEEREALSELIGFFFGKQLVKIGETQFDERGNWISQTSFQKLFHPYPKKFKEAAVPPIDLFEQWQEGGIGKLIEKYFPMYLQLRSDIHLDDIIWHIWQTDHATLDQQIPTIVLGIEHLAKNWFKSQHSKTAGVYLPKKEYLELIAPEMVTLKEKLSQYDDGEKIIRKINSAFQMSTTDRWVRLFRDLNLEIGDIEGDIFRNRNKFSHGHTLSSDEEIREAMKLSMAARSLLNRIILRILNHSDMYVDYSLDNHRAKPLEIPLGS